MKTRKGKKVPAGEMKDSEVAETLFGKRTLNKVRKEIEEAEPTENEEESGKEASIDKQGS